LVELLVPASPKQWGLQHTNAKISTVLTEDSAIRLVSDLFECATSHPSPALHARILAVALRRRRIWTPESNGVNDSAECAVVIIAKQLDQLRLRFWTLRRAIHTCKMSLSRAKVA
jgi:hypothetical protein